MKGLFELLGDIFLGTARCKYGVRLSQHGFFWDNQCPGCYGDAERRAEKAVQDVRAIKLWELAKELRPILNELDKREAREKTR